jgi:hypothetical protein
MPTAEKSLPRSRRADVNYSYRRQLSLSELLPAVGIAVGAGFFAYYITRLLLERTPLEIEPLSGHQKTRLSRHSRAHTLERLAEE